MRGFERNQVASRVPLGSLGIDRDTIPQFTMRQNGFRLLFYRNGMVRQNYLYLSIKYLIHI